MPKYETQQDLIAYITELERRITLLERSAVRIDFTTTRASMTASAGRIIYDTSGTPKLYAGNGSTWNALW
jgi:hypothetical protein